MSHAPSPEEIRAFAERHSLTEEQAGQVLAELGADESKWNETVRSLVHFIKAPS